MLCAPLPIFVWVMIVKEPILPSVPPWFDCLGLKLLVRWYLPAVASLLYTAVPHASVAYR